MGSCRLCIDDKSSVYIGETSRTLFTRVNQHYKDFLKTRNRPSSNNVDQNSDDNVTSWIVDHVKDKHQDAVKDSPEDLIEFAVISSHRDPFSRQSVESVRIQDALNKGELKLGKKTAKIHSLNRKGEFFAAKERWDSRRRN